MPWRYDIIDEMYVPAEKMASIMTVIMKIGVQVHTETMYIKKRTNERQLKFI